MFNMLVYLEVCLLSRDTAKTYLASEVGSHLISVVQICVTL